MQFSNANKTWIHLILTFILSLAFTSDTHAQADNFCALPTNTAAKNGSDNGVDLSFPVEGTVNALIIFVQHQDDDDQDCRRLLGYDNLGIADFGETRFDYSTFCDGNPDSDAIGGYQSWTEDPTTEWPAGLSAGPTNRTRQLPDWAEDIIDAPGSSNFTSGSLSDLYNKMSNGKFTLTGEVWDYTYIPEHPLGDYDGLSGSTFNNGAIMLSHEIISYINNNPYGINLSSSVWDKYTNGTGADDTPDGKFDMIVLVFRNSGLTTLAPNVTSGASSFASLGFDSPSGDGFMNSPLSLGSYSVIDNVTSGSGVFTQAHTKKLALRTIAHEIGHRQFGAYHTNQLGGSHENSDYLSIMGTSHLSFSAGDRIKLGWANVQYVDVSGTNTYQSYTLRDAAVVNQSETDVIWLRSGSSNACGDVVIEARMRSTYLDSPPGSGNDDGDESDFYLPNEGLYISKAPIITSNQSTTTCGAKRAFYSSIPNGGRDTRRAYFGGDTNNPAGMYLPGFGIGDQYSPFTIAPYDFHGLSTVDDFVAVTNITKSSNQFSFKVWSDFPEDDTHGTKVLRSPYDFDKDRALGRPGTNFWTLGGKFQFDGEFDIDGITFRGSPSWQGLHITADGTIKNSEISRIGGGAGNAAVSIYNAEPTLDNVFIDVEPSSYVYGVYMNGAYHTARITNSTIRSRSAPAIYVNGSYNYLNIYNTDIIQESSNQAVYASGGGRPYFWPGSVSPYVGYNKVKGGRLYATGNGVISAGSASSTTSSNHFCNAASAYLEATSGGEIFAKYNYWYNNTNPIQDDHGGSGTIYYSNKLGTADCSDVQYRMATASTETVPLNAVPILAASEVSRTTDPLQVASPLNDLRDRLFAAREHREKGRYNEAKALLLDLVAHEDKPEARSALLELGALHGNTKDRAVFGLIKSLTVREGPLRSTALSLLASAYAFEGQDQAAQETLGNLIESYTGTSEEFYGKLTLFNLHLSANRAEEAAQVLESVQPRSENESYEVAAAQRLLEIEAGIRIETPHARKVKSSDQQSGEEFISATESTLKAANYPNPFNPSTTIRYSLGSASNVLLTVYDVLGREVAVLVDGKVKAGSHEAVFDASNLPSGTYLYRLEANGQFSTGRMLLLK